MKKSTFTCDKCGTTNNKIKDGKTVSEIPSGWISIKIKHYENDDSSYPKKINYMANFDEQHFCSKKCFIDYLF